MSRRRRPPRSGPIEWEGPLAILATIAGCIAVLGAVLALALHLG